MLRPPDRNRLRASLAPEIAATAEWTDDLLRLFVLGFVDEKRV